MDRDMMRLECLKMAVSKTTDHKDSLLRAEEYFSFVTDEKDKNQTQVSHGVAVEKRATPKKSDNAKNLY